MRLPVDALWLAITTIMAIAYFGPRTSASWPKSLTVLMWLTVGGLALFALALKGLTGKGPEDYAAETLFETVCRFATISDNCPSAVRARMDAEAAQTMQKIKDVGALQQFEQRMRESKAKPIVSCGMAVAEPTLDIRHRKVKDIPNIFTYFSDPGEPSYFRAYLFLPKDTFALCTPADGRPPFELNIPPTVQACSFTQHRFACW